KELIELLPPMQRDTIILKLYKNLKFKEIAKQTNCDINTALARFRLGIERLKKLADSDNFVL
ncbi:MAG: RNA polymerase subunit sigma-24, partial [Sediminibacterium sp.]|nr:RNA polymerase subunit sigma-24 [Sediminibacterium sp.]